MGKGAIPEYTFWHDEKLDYIQARKKLYATKYAENVKGTSSYQLLQRTYYKSIREKKDLVLLDYDAYDHNALNMTLLDVINNPNRKMGHAFVLIMMLTECLEDCMK
jgi:hypothetical protein